MIQQKVEIRFEKSEEVRFISHHDLMRALLRAVRRSRIPVRLTEGFNPRPRIVFPVALEVGVSSLDEVAEIELNECLQTQEIFVRLSSVFPPGLVLKSVKDLPPRRAGQIPIRIKYRIHLQQTQIRIKAQDLEMLLAAKALMFERPRENHLQNVDLRPALERLELEPSGDLLADVKPSPSGSARPLEALSLLSRLPLDKLKNIRVTKLSMEFAPVAPLSEEAVLERNILLLRNKHNPPIYSQKPQIPAADGRIHLEQMPMML